MNGKIQKLCDGGDDTVQDDDDADGVQNFQFSLKLVSSGS